MVYPKIICPFLSVNQKNRSQFAKPLTPPLSSVQIPFQPPRQKARQLLKRQQHQLSTSTSEEETDTDEVDNPNKQSSGSRKSRASSQRYVIVSERQLYYYYYYLKNLLFLSVNLLFLYIIETHFSLCVILLFTINVLNNQLVFRKLEIIKVIKKICLK